MASLPPGFFPCVYSTERVCNLPESAVIVDAVEEDHCQRGEKMVDFGGVFRR